MGAATKLLAEMNRLVMLQRGLWWARCTGKGPGVAGGAKREGGSHITNKLSLTHDLRARHPWQAPITTRLPCDSCAQQPVMARHLFPTTRMGAHIAPTHLPAARFLTRLAAPPCPRQPLATIRLSCL